MNAPKIVGGIVLLFGLGVAIFAGVLWLDGRMELRLLAAISGTAAVAAIALGALILRSSAVSKRSGSRIRP